MQELLARKDLTAFLKYTLSTLKGHRPDVGDVCVPVPGEFEGAGGGFLRQKSHDAGQGPLRDAQTLSTLSSASSRSYGRSVSSGESHVSEEREGDRQDREGEREALSDSEVAAAPPRDNTALNTAFNKILSSARGGAGDAGGGARGDGAAGGEERCAEVEGMGGSKGVVHRGGQRKDVAAPIAKLPLFERQA